MDGWRAEGLTLQQSQPEKLQITFDAILVASQL